MPLPFDTRRRADLTFTSAGLYVFVDGCFWHGCREHFVLPKTRRDFWLDKIESNRRRDLETCLRLEGLGATVLRIWEHEDPIRAANTVERRYRILKSQSTRLRRSRTLRSGGERLAGEG
jgi:DNA mismatch endonuclease (patch repair protein)